LEKEKSGVDEAERTPVAGGQRVGDDKFSAE